MKTEICAPSLIHIKMKALIFLTLSSLLFFIFACNKKAEEGTLVEFRSLPALKFCNIEQAPAGKEAHHVIKSQREYQELLGCRANAPDINFNKEFVLAGWIAYTHCASKKRRYPTGQ